MPRLSPFAICHLPSAICHLPSASAIPRLPASISHLLSASAICHLSSAIGDWLFALSPPRSPACHQQPPALTFPPVQDDTIVAIATPLGEGGLAVIRISGPQALAVA